MKNKALNREINKDKFCQSKCRRSLKIMIKGNKNRRKQRKPEELIFKHSGDQTLTQTIH